MSHENANFRKYFIIVVAILIGLVGPYDSSISYMLWIRIGYMILLPSTLWFLLKFIWTKFTPTLRTEQILVKILSCCIALALIIAAYFEYISKTHFENSATIRTRDGFEEVGNDYIANGPNLGNVFLLLLLSLIFINDAFPFIKNTNKRTW